MMADMTDSDPQLSKLAQEVAAALERSASQLVLAESCTAGLVAASLGSIPGISRHLCGSAVVYQERTKVAWLGVSERTLQQVGAVSEEVAREMTATVLAKTPYADLAAAVTGHLGPGAPAELDGVIFIAVQSPGTAANVERHVLRGIAGLLPSDFRIRRQREAAALVLKSLLTWLQRGSPQT